MPKIDLKNILILMFMAVLGFYVTTWIVKKYGD